MVIPNSNFIHQIPRNSHLNFRLHTPVHLFGITIMPSELQGTLLTLSFSPSFPSLFLSHPFRKNVYMGLAGGFVLRDKAEASLKLPSGEFEVPLVLQGLCWGFSCGLQESNFQAFFPQILTVFLDRSFMLDGSNTIQLYYPPDFSVSEPFAADEFVGRQAVVNGTHVLYYYISLTYQPSSLFFSSSTFPLSFSFSFCSRSYHSLLVHKANTLPPSTSWGNSSQIMDPKFHNRRSY